MATDKKNVQWLIDNIYKTNIADEIDESTLGLIAAEVVTGYELDKASRKDWEEQTEEGMKIAKQVKENKTFPWPNAANVKYPLIATAAIQFASRAYPELVRGQDVVKGQVIGRDPSGTKEARSKRVSTYMSWQCLEEMPEWEPDTDTMLHMLPVVGTCFKKTYYSSLLNRNVSELVSPLQLVVNNDCARDVETARRITQELYLYKNDVIERERRDLFLPVAQYLTDNDEKSQEIFLEQHCWIDLDGDDYEEPYIVTVHYASGQVARIAPRYDEAGIEINAKNKVVKITPVGYFTKFSFIPSPDGKFYDIGFAHMLGPINETLNTVINQLLDAGALSNVQGGFIGKGIRGINGRMKFDLGEWKQVEVTGGTLKDNIVPLPVAGPSNVLFQLLGSLNDAGMRLASVSETLTGETPGQNVPATTTLAMIEQGLKVFSSIYKRIFRAFKAEYKKLYRLNGIYPNQEMYATVLDEDQVDCKADFNAKDVDIQPVSDPTLSSEAIRMARANALMQTLQINPTNGGKLEILKRYYEAISTPEIEKLLPMEELNAPKPPDPDMIRLQAEITAQQSKAEIDEKKVELEADKLQLEIHKTEAEIELIKAQAIKTIAEAESKEIGQQFELYAHQVDTLMADRKMQLDHMARMQQLKAQQEQAEQPETEGGEPQQEEPAEQPESHPQSGELPPPIPIDNGPGGSTAEQAGAAGMSGAEALPAMEQEVLGDRTKNIVAAGGPSGLQPGQM